MIQQLFPIEEPKKPQPDLAARLTEMLAQNFAAEDIDNSSEFWDRVETQLREELNGQPPKKNSAESVAIPLALETPEFRLAWSEWLKERKARRSPVSARAASMQLKSLQTFGGVENAIKSIEQSIERGYAGLFDPRPASGNRTQTRTTNQPAKTWDDYKRI